MTHGAETDEKKAFLESLNRYWAESRAVHVCRLDREGRVLEINTCFADLLKRKPETVKGHPFSEFLTDPDARMIKERLASRIPPESCGFLLNVVDADLAPQTLQCWEICLSRDQRLILGELPEHRCHLLQQELLELNNQLATLSRETARQKKELARALEERDAAYRKMAEMAFHDPLTLLANRRKLEETFHLEVERASRLGQPLTVVMMDIDHFKSINDTYGHAMGDQVLKELARTVSRQARPYDLVSRYGGEEFLILMPGIGIEQGKSAAERFRTCVSEARIDGIPHPVTASFGVATLKPGQLPHTVFDRADQALYRAKATGRNRVVVEPTEENEGAMSE
uniref:diguanylate cyclase n=1 Tax=Desulfatirhabdium butyrativorans TaxID=340467 RepID=A0A7C4RQB6_9BACT